MPYIYALYICPIYMPQRGGMEATYLHLHANQHNQHICSFNRHIWGKPLVPKPGTPKWGPYWRNRIS